MWTIVIWGIQRKLHEIVRVHWPKFLYFTPHHSTTFTTLLHNFCISPKHLVKQNFHRYLWGVKRTGASVGIAQDLLLILYLEITLVVFRASRNQTRVEKANILIVLLLSLALTLWMHTLPHKEHLFLDCCNPHHYPDSTWFISQQKALLCHFGLCSQQSLFRRSACSSVTGCLDCQFLKQQK